MVVDVSLVVPTYNEIDNISTCLSALVTSLSKEKISYEVVVVDDGSNDGTVAFVRDFSKKHKHVRLLLRKNERGFGSAIFYGIVHAKGTYVIPFMADLSDTPEDAIRVFRKLEEGYDMVFTTRFKHGNRARSYPFLKFLSNRIYNHIISFVCGIPFKDTSNAFKGFRCEVVKDVVLVHSGFEVTTELAMKSLARSKRVSEIKVSWHNRDKGTQKSDLRKIAVGYFNVLKMLHTQGILKQLRKRKY